MEEEIEQEFEPIEIDLDPAVNGVSHVTVTRIDKEQNYYVFRATGEDGEEIGGTSARTAQASGVATSENAEADIIASLS